MPTVSTNTICQSIHATRPDPRISPQHKQHTHTHMSSDICRQKILLFEFELPKQWFCSALHFDHRSLTFFGTQFTTSHGSSVRSSLGSNWSPLMKQLTSVETSFYGNSNEQLGNDSEYAMLPDLLGNNKVTCTFNVENGRDSKRRR